MSEIRTDFAPGVLTGEDVKDVFALAKAKGFAIPAANCTGSNTMNGVMETAAAVSSPVAPIERGRRSEKANACWWQSAHAMELLKDNRRS